MPGQKKNRFDGITIKVLSYMGLVYAVVGWLNEVLFQWTANVFLSHYSEYIAMRYGHPRSASHRNKK